VNAGTNPIPPNPPAESTWRWLWATFVAVVRQRCPQCRQGRIFRGTFAMNDPCPVCGVVFQREEGYFLGSMYVSYLLSSVLLIGFYYALVALLPGWGTITVAFLALIPYLPLVPLVFRYSRVVWIHFERSGSPSDVSAGPYEKARLKEAADRKIDAGR
jgi:uncharacterized protein (DUF983 family)